METKIIEHHYRFNVGLGGIVFMTVLGIFTMNVLEFCLNYKLEKERK